MTRRQLALCGALVTLLCGPSHIRPIAAQNATLERSSVAVSTSASVAGRVIDAMTGASVADAMITLEGVGPTPLRQLANTDGRFAFRNLSGSDAMLTVKADGYSNESGGDGQPPNPDLFFSLAEGQQKDLTVKLWKPAAIGGRIYGDAGEPVPGVDVWLVQALGSNLSTSSPIQTDDRGSFRFSSLQPGIYFVGIRGATFAASARTSALATSGAWPLAYRTTFYPGTTALLNAQAISLRAGDDRPDLDFHFSPLPTARVSGTVADSSGPVPSLGLELVLEDPGRTHHLGPFTPTTITDATGAFAFVGVPPGQYTITGTRHVTGPRALVEWVRTPLTVGTSAVQGITLTTHATVSVAGDVQFSGGQAPSSQDLGKLHLRWERFESSLEGPSSSECALHADGTFVVDELVPGHYTAQFSGSDDWVVSSVTTAGIAASDAAIDVRAPARDVLVNVLHSSALAEIQGTVVPDSSSTVPALVVVIPASTALDPANAWRHYFQRAIMESNHHFELTKLLPGDYFVAAIDLADARLGWEFPDTVATLISRATRVSLAPGTHRVLDLKPVQLR